MLKTCLSQSFDSLLGALKTCQITVFLIKSCYQPNYTIYGLHMCKLPSWAMSTTTLHTCTLVLVNTLQITGPKITATFVNLLGA